MLKNHNVYFSELYETVVKPLVILANLKQEKFPQPIDMEKQQQNNLWLKVFLPSIG